MSTTAIGREAESAVADALRKLKHAIVAQNWRSRWCEIDVISTHKKTVYFTEVKYRSNDAWGSGLEYITPKKLQQMQFAAEFWLAENGWSGEVVLQGAEVDSAMRVTIVEISD